MVFFKASRKNTACKIVSMKCIPDSGMRLRFVPDSEMRARLQKQIRNWEEK